MSRLHRDDWLAIVGVILGWLLLMLLFFAFMWCEHTDAEGLWGTTTRS